MPCHFIVARTKRKEYTIRRYKYSFSIALPTAYKRLGVILKRIPWSIYLIWFEKQTIGNTLVHQFWVHYFNYRVWRKCIRIWLILLCHVVEKHFLHIFSRKFGISHMILLLGILQGKNIYHFRVGTTAGIIGPIHHHSSLHSILLLYVSTSNSFRDFDVL